MKKKKEKKANSRRQPQLVLVTLSQVWIGLSNMPNGIQYISQIKDHSLLSSKPTTQESIKKK